MVSREHVHPKVANKLLKAFLSADLHYQLSGIPHHVSLEREARKHLGQARRLITQVAALGPDAAVWMKYFIESMENGE